MQTIELVAGSTFAFAGPVSHLSGAVAWGLSAAVRVKNATTDLDNFTCTIAQASDFSTSGLWNVSLSATAVQTAAWYQAANLKGGELLFDLKFFNTAGADPVLRTEPLTLKLSAPVTG